MAGLALHLPGLRKEVCACARMTEPRSYSYLHLLHHLLAKGAHLGGAGDGHVLGALVLARHAVERPGVILHVAVQVCLGWGSNTGQGSGFQQHFKGTVC